MNAQDLITFLQLIAVPEQNISVSDGWVSCSCPLASARHEHGADGRPSFFVSVHEDVPSLWHCFGCTEKSAPLDVLLQTVWLCLGWYPWDAADFFVAHEIGKHETPVLLPTVGTGWLPRKTSPRFIPEDCLEGLPLLVESRDAEARKIWDWLITERQVSRQAAGKCGVRYWPGRGVLVFPHTDNQGRTVMLRTRSIHEKRIFTITPRLLGLDVDFPRRKEVGCWFGARDSGYRPILLVEGEIDVLRLVTLGLDEFNILAAGGSKMTNSQLSLLGNPTIFLGFDADKEGYRSANRVATRLSLTHSVYFVDWAVAGVKDPGDLPDIQALRRVINKSRAIISDNH
jgi:Toprim-like